MFNFVGKMLGSEKALTKTIDSVTNGLDALVYTKEEKAQDGAAARSEARGMVVKWMEATQGQNLARRIIALGITAVWLVQYIIAQIYDSVAVWVSEPEIWHAAAEVMREGARDMSSPVMLILAFYFAAPHMDQVVGRLLGNINKQGK